MASDSCDREPTEKNTWRRRIETRRVAIARNAIVSRNGLSMCGICGVISRSPIRPEQSETVRRIGAALVHRGPDGAGEFVGPNAHLAMRRLAIIDLNGGWQPLYNEDKSIALVANGEVYNYIELRQELESKGHRYRTGSDCESIIHAYEQYGPEFVHKLRGMYAFALYDLKNRKVILGRDRMGEKPMYLVERDGEVWFGSELRSIMAGRLVPFKLDAAAVQDYFHYMYVPEPRTPVVGVRKLPAGHTLTFDLETWKVEQKCYWRLVDAPPVEGDPKTLIREELERIAELVTRADVPIAVALSAGIDSSAIAALVARQRPGQVHAITIGYKDKSRQDEREPARRWAKELGMPFHDVEVSAREFVELFAERSYWRDDPIADTAGHNYFALSRASRSAGIPVLLQGQGGDELFWGYSWVRQAARLSRLKAEGKLDDPEQRWERIRDLLPYGKSNGTMRTWALRTLGHYYGYRRVNPDAGTPTDRPVFYNLAGEFQMGKWAMSRLLTPEFRAQFNGRDPGEVYDIPMPWPDIGAMITSLICGTYLVENGMVQGDRLSMVNSVEVRLPLSDYRLAELAVGLRKARPDDHLPPKHWLKEATKDLLPDWILNRPKTGFTPPTKTWMPALLSAYELSLPDGYLVSHGILDPGGAAWLSQPAGRAAARTDLFYRALVLEFWCRGAETAAGSDLHHSMRVPTSS